MGKKKKQQEDSFGLDNIWGFAENVFNTIGELTGYGMAKLLQFGFSKAYSSQPEVADEIYKNFEPMPLSEKTKRNLYVTGSFLETPFRELVVQPRVTQNIVNQQVQRNPEKYLNNQEAYSKLWADAHLAAIGNRNGKEWWESGEDPVTYGQSFYYLQKADTLGLFDTPDLLDKDAVNKYFEETEGIAKNTTGVMDFVSTVMLDPLNIVPGIGFVKYGSKGTKVVAQTADTIGDISKIQAPPTTPLTKEKITEVINTYKDFGAEEISDVVNYTNDIATQNLKLDKFIYYNTKEYEDTAYAVKNYIAEDNFSIIDKMLPEEAITPLQFEDAKYFVVDRNAWAVTDNTFFEWVWPYVNSKGKSVNGHWRKSLRLPRPMITKTSIQKEIVDKSSIEYTTRDVMKMFPEETISVVPGLRNIIVDQGMARYPHLADAFKNSLRAVEARNGQMGLTSDAYKLPVLDFVDNTISRVPGFTQRDLSFAVFYIKGRRVIVAHNARNNTFYTLDSYMPAYKKGKPTEKDVDDMLSKGLSDDADLQKVMDEKRNEKTLDVSEETSREFVRLLDDAPEGVFDDFEDFSPASAFGKSGDEALEELEQAAKPITVVQSKKRKLIWVRQPWFNLNSADAYEVVFHSPLNGGRMSTRVPAEYKLVKAPYSADGEIVLPEFVKIVDSTTGIAEKKIYSVDYYGNIVPISEARSSYSRVMEAYTRAELEIAESRKQFILNNINKIKGNELSIDKTIKSINRQMEILYPKIQKNKARIKQLKERIRRLEDLTPEEEALLRDAVSFEKLQAQLDNLIYSKNLYNDLPKTPEETGIWFKLDELVDEASGDPSYSLSLVRRTLDWDDFDVTVRELNGQSDEIIHTWQLTKNQLDEINKQSVFNRGWSTEWPLFKERNIGDDAVYSINSKELVHFATKKSFRIKDYRMHINKIRRKFGKDPMPSSTAKRERDYISFLREVLNNNAREDLLELIKAEQWALKRSVNMSIKESERAYAERALIQLRENIANKKAEISKDIDYLEDIMARADFEDLTPAAWQSIFGEIPKTEVYINNFLTTLNKLTGTNVSLTDAPIQALRIDKTGNWVPGPLKEVEELPVAAREATQKELQKLEEWTTNINKSPEQVDSIEGITGTKAIPEEILDTVKIQNEMSDFEKIEFENTILDFVPVQFADETIQPTAMSKPIEIKEGSIDIPNSHARRYAEKYEGEGNITAPVYELSTTGEKYAFQGALQDFSEIAKSGIRVVSTTPEGIIQEVLRLSPGNKKLESLLNNFKSKNYTAEENKFLDLILASVSVDKNGQKLPHENPEGFLNLILALSGNREAIKIIDNQLSSFYKIVKDVKDLEESKIAERIQKWIKETDGVYQIEVDETQIPVIRSSGFGFTRNKDGSIDLLPGAHYRLGSEFPNSRSSVHFTLGGTVSSHMWGSWDIAQPRLVTSYSSMRKSNGNPRSLDGFDTWWLLNPGETLKVTDGVIITPFKDTKNYTSELAKRGFTDKNLPIIYVDSKTKDILHMLKKEYTDADRLEIFEAAKKIGLKKITKENSEEVDLISPESFIGHESEVIRSVVEQMAKEELGIDYPLVQVYKNHTSSKALEEQVRSLRAKYNLNGGIHEGTPEFQIEKGTITTSRRINPDVDTYAEFTMPNIETFSKLNAPIQAMRWAALFGFFKTGKIKSIYDIGA